MFLFLLLALSCVHSASASSLLNMPIDITPRDDIKDTILNTLNGNRSVLNILWSCLATIIACTWVSAHPNIPPRDEKTQFLIMRRIGLMLMTIVAPEWVLLYAMREWHGARKLAHEMRLRGYQWTTTHGYFAQMGGFLLYDGKERVGILDHWLLHALLVEDRTVVLCEREISKEDVQFPEVSEEELEDRSKGDGLSKALAVTQSFWFVIQLILRWAQGLIVTKLELFTLGFAAFTGMIYFMWWKKPLDIGFAIPVNLKRRLRDVAAQTGSDDTTSDLIISPTSDSTLTTKKRFSCDLDDWKADVTVLVVPIEGKHEGDGYSYSDDQDGEINAETLVPAPHWQLEDILDTAKAFTVMTVSYVLKWHRIPTSSRELHAAWKDYNLDRAHYLRVPLGDAYINPYEDFYIHAIASTTFILFGAVHCAAWYFSFPTTSERIFWRLCAVLITVIPVVTNFGSWYYFDRRPSASRKSSPCREQAYPSPWKFIIAIPATLTILLYVNARFGLFLESLLTLRDLAPGALAQVDWTTLLPHI